MTTTGFKKTGDWKRLLRMLDPNVFRPILEKHVGPAVGRAGHLVQGRVRKAIKEGMTPPNAALTILIKKTSKPLVAGGDLIQSVTVDQQTWNSCFVGVLRTDKNFNVARIVHNGATVVVTDRMRAMFELLWLVGQGRMNPGKLRGRAAELWAQAPGSFWRPLKDTTKAIVIPPRPFLRQVFEHLGTKSLVGKIFAAALRDAVHEAAKSGPAGS